MKRICLFAGYNPFDVIPLYVIDYIKELSNYADIYYLSSRIISEKQLDRIRPYTKNCWAIKHDKYDFGSYSELAKNYVGWDVIEKYDELILANDSCICVQSFKPVFEKMEKKNLDAWALTMTDELSIYHTYMNSDYLKDKSLHSCCFCLNSYFLAFSPKVFNNDVFRTFLNNVKKEASRIEVCINYEFRLTKILEDMNYKIGAFIDKMYQGVYIYGDKAFLIIKDGMPLLKAKFFSEGIGKNAKYYIDFIEKNYNPNIKKYINELFINVKLKYKYNKLIKKIKNKLKRNYFFSELIWLLEKNKYYQKEKTLQGYAPSEIKNYKKHQKSLVKEYKNCKNIAVFLNTARDTVNDEMLFVNNLVEISAGRIKDFGYETLLSNIPTKNAAIRHTLYKDALDMIDFNYFLKYCNPDNLIINLPDTFIKKFVSDLDFTQRIKLQNIKKLRINVINQKAEQLPPHYNFVQLFNYTTDVTLTVTSEEYNLSDLAHQYCCPVFLVNSSDCSNYLANLYNNIPEYVPE